MPADSAAEGRIERSTLKNRFIRENHETQYTPEFRRELSGGFSVLRAERWRKNHHDDDAGRDAGSEPPCQSRRHCTRAHEYCEHRTDRKRCARRTLRTDAQRVSLSRPGFGRGNGANLRRSQWTGRGVYAAGRDFLCLAFRHAARSFRSLVDADLRIDPINPGPRPGFHPGETNPEPNKEQS